jgi:hypothetical protein
MSEDERLAILKMGRRASEFEEPDEAIDVEERDDKMHWFNDGNIF